MTLEYRYCDDWLIYAGDAEGNLHYVSTELWPEWVDAAANKFGLDPDSTLAAYRTREIDEEPDAVERYMLPVARERWERLPWRRVPDDK